MNERIEGHQTDIYRSENLFLFELFEKEQKNFI